jgi:hypothetical protein
MPQQGWHANISFARPATEMVCEVNNYAGSSVQSPTQNIHFADRMRAHRLMATLPR